MLIIKATVSVEPVITSVGQSDGTILEFISFQATLPTAQPACCETEIYWIDPATIGDE